MLIVKLFFIYIVFFEIVLNIASFYNIINNAINYKSYYFKEINLFSSHNLNSQKNPDLASSVWCKAVLNNRICNFKNLCYVPRLKLYMFIYSNSSIFSGIKKKDLKYIQMSSVMEHTSTVMNLALVSPSNTILNDVLFINEQVFLLWRFKRDNIMHIIHDDLLPLYMTYNEICFGDPSNCSAQYRLGFADSDDKGPHYYLYSLFSKDDPILFDSKSSVVTCFRNTFVGLLSTSVWYQYGFDKPQGPVEAINFNGGMLKGFTDFIVEKIKREKVFEEYSTKNNQFGVLLNRKLNRRIVNENFVVTAMEKKYHDTFNATLEVKSVDLSDTHLYSLISLIKNADVVVGMHGSAMILSMFVKPGSVVIELFPFGINPDYVSFLKSMASLIGVQFTYRSWINNVENNSFPNENAHPLFGGIKHFAEVEQLRIKSVKSVPAVTCCHNPVYLYRMFQDTVVDSSLIAVLEEVFIFRHKENLRLTEDYNKKEFNQWYFPSSVSNIRCEVINHDLIIGWDEPINLEGRSPAYKIGIQFSNGKFTSRKSYSTHIKIPFLEYIESDNNFSVDIWFSCETEEDKSIDVHSLCTV